MWVVIFIGFATCLETINLAHCLVSTTVFVDRVKFFVRYAQRKELIHGEHKVKTMLKDVQDKSATLLRLYEDEDGYAMLMVVSV